jgi:hypothetical protein
MTDDLLTIEDIAKLYRVSYRTARDVTTKNRGFPAPIPGSTRRKPLWLRETIEAYVRGGLTQV